MTTKTKLTLMACMMALLAALVLLNLEKKIHVDATQSIAQQREKHQEFLNNSPFKETKKWDKKKRKAEGLPPKPYYEQMWELTINPASGKLDTEELSLLREALVQKRSNELTPGDALNAWEEKGPNDVGGRTRAILFDPNDPNGNTVYAGGVSGGLWVNTNIASSSSSWTRVQNVPGNLSVTSITVDPRNSNIWYLGTGEQYTFGDAVGSGVYKSTDGGNSWNAVNIPPAGDGSSTNGNNVFLSGIYFVNDIIAWDNGTSTELFVGVGSNNIRHLPNWLGLDSSGLYRSTDGGNTWSRINTPNMQFNYGGQPFNMIPNDFEIGADNRLWMGTIATPNRGLEGGGRIFSTTNGATWAEATASPLKYSNRVELAVSATNPNRMHALTQVTLTDSLRKQPIQMYSTLDGFSSVRTTRTLPNAADINIPDNDFTRGQAWYNLLIEVDPNNDDIVYVGGIDLFRSTNGGNSWTQISKWSNNNAMRDLPVSIVHADQHAMTFRPGNSNQAIFGNDGGVYYNPNLSLSQTTSNFIHSNKNYNVTQFVSASIGPQVVGDEKGIIAAGSQDNGTVAIRGNSLQPGINDSQEVSGGDGFKTFIDKDGEYMISTLTHNRIYRFNLPWNGFPADISTGNTVLLYDETTGDFVNPMDYDDEANRLLTNNSNDTQRSIRSIDVAANTNGILTNNLLTDRPTAFRASPFTNNRWYVGLANGRLLRLSNVTNNSAIWENITTPFVGSVSSIRFGQTANDLIVTIHNYGVTSVWYSSNAGASWVSKEGNLPNIPVRDFLINPLNSNEAILATQLGVWQTSNFNATNPLWTQAYNGMSDVSVTAFDYWAVNGEDADNKVIASTYGRGLYTGKFTAPDNTAPVITLVGPATINLNVGEAYSEQGAIAGDNTEGNITANLVISGAVNTNNTGTYTINYNVSDAAGNAATQVSRTVIVTELPATCNNTSISSFPYTESFENTFGDWTQSNVDDLDWILKTGSTLSGGTGPSSANDGTYYIYVEASGFGTGYPNKSATLNSPCFDLRNQTSAAFSFMYHQFGDPDMGSITLDASIDGGNWSSIWFSSSNQGEAWQTANIDLSDYLGGTVQLRFNRVTGNTWKADIAIDQVSLTTGTPGCLEGISSFPYNESFENTLGDWTQSYTDDTDWTLRTGNTPSPGTGPSSAIDGTHYIYVEASEAENSVAILNSPCFDLRNQLSATFSFKYHQFGDNNMGFIDLEVSIDNGETWDFIWYESGNLGDAWQTANVDLSNYVGGTIQLRFNRLIGSSLKADIAIDEVSLRIGPPSCTGEVSSFPYTESFENTFGDWTQSNVDDLDWTLKTGGTPSGGTGPSSANNGTHYIYVEASGSGSGFPNKRAILNSPCFDLRNQPSATFSFMYHQFGDSDMGSIVLEASNDNGASWFNIWFSSGNQGDAWQTANIDLSNYLGDTVQLRFNRTTGSTWKADIAIDQLSLTNTSSIAKVDNTVVDVVETKTPFEIQIFPNPVKGPVLNVKTVIDNVSYKVYNMVGQLVSKGSLNTSTMDVSRLQSGAYIIEFSNHEEKVLKRFIKE